MFNKKNCPHCNSKISNNYEFCPSCGKQIKQISHEDYGMLGTNDIIPEPIMPGIKLPFGFNTLFNSLTRTLAKEMQSLGEDFDEIENKPKQKQNQPRVKQGGFSINISTLGGTPPRIHINQFGKPQNQPPQRQAQPQQAQQTQKQQVKKIQLPQFSKDQQKKFSEFETLEPETNIRRLANSLIYEIKLPNTKTEKDISITKLQKTIEIKAISKDKSYFKSLQVPFPIRGYEFEKGTLTLELFAGN